MGTHECGLLVRLSKIGGCKLGFSKGVVLNYLHRKRLYSGVWYIEVDDAGLMCYRVSDTCIYISRTLDNKLNNLEKHARLGKRICKIKYYSRCSQNISVQRKSVCLHKVSANLQITMHTIFGCNTDIKNG